VEEEVAVRAGVGTVVVLVVVAAVVIITGNIVCVAEYIFSGVYASYN
jgi:hypothetical protein